MAGRDTPSRGLELTARYVAEELRKAGFAAAGDSASYLQRYALRGAKRKSGAGRHVAAESGGLTASAHPLFRSDSAPNVVGILYGADPALRDEFVLVSAHMDHLGVRAGEADSIWNGADDNASGTAGVIELAEAFAIARPRRSIILLTVSGEERGLLGSTHFANHPPVPIDRVVAAFNLDMIGRNWKDTIVVIGKDHSDLGATLLRVNALHPELCIEAIDDLWPEEDFYSRSDHFNFARRGVPVLFFFNGTHVDYHEASDSPEKVDVEKEARIVQLVYYMGLEIANSDDRPRWKDESRKRIVERGRR
ncbi:MAG: hypothetical protein MNPFHGCM_02803 [Gemmatimonadaceae bacterium]|nr:hypothetical protein [Gemmatimonadaceae bacterium]